MSGADDDLARELAAFSAEYRASLPQRLADIDAAWTSVKNGRGGRDTVHALLRGLHSIAGSALTFGLPALGRAAAAAEDWIEPYDERGEMPPATTFDAFEALLGALRREAP